MLNWGFQKKKKVPPIPQPGGIFFIGEENPRLNGSMWLRKMICLLVTSWVLPKIGGKPPMWMVYNGKPYWKWMIWGLHYFWKHPVSKFVFFQPWLMAISQDFKRRSSFFEMSIEFGPISMYLGVFFGLMISDFLSCKKVTILKRFQHFYPWKMVRNPKGNGLVFQPSCFSGARYVSFEGVYTDRVFENPTIFKWICGYSVPFQVYGAFFPGILTIPSEIDHEDQPSFPTINSHTFPRLVHPGAYRMCFPLKISIWW